MPDFTPTNELERLLVQASTDPGARPAFYRAFMDADLIVLGYSGQPIAEGEGVAVLPAGSTVNIVRWQGQDGREAIPVFSSLERLRESIAQEERYMQIEGRVLLDIVGSALPLVLNPMSDYGKEFVPEELASMQDGSIFRRLESTTVEENRQVLIGQPANYPQALVDALKSLFSRHPEVERAYLAQMHDPAAGASPFLIVGVQAQGDMGQVMSDAGIAIQGALAEGEGVQFFQVRVGDDGLSGYMVGSVEPFYVRS
ncbi:MAG TPA: enhanced serine sensitivity protein SseB C-terminal domain-containing protein [Chloroflexia bacterium]|jgi:hypothetical protein